MTQRLKICLLSAGLLPGISDSVEAHQGRSGALDTGLTARPLETHIQHDRASFTAEKWMRIRGVTLGDGDDREKARAVAGAEHATLARMRATGTRICVLLRVKPGYWSDPGRAMQVAAYASGPSRRRLHLPEDLRAVYVHARELGEFYGDVVDAWEIDNEPDLAFVPEAAEEYAAFLKACWLGLRRGVADARTKGGYGNGAPGASAPSAGLEPQASGSRRDSIVLMGALGLPPGPWLERFVDNDGLSYTDGYNYHYYGYAADFSAVYRSHEAAVASLSAEHVQRNATDGAAAPMSDRGLPVFLTEIGYGMLSGEAAGTKEGRLRQWRWFKSVGEQAGALRIEAPMAFLLLPYLEYGRYEYGLAVPAKPEARGFELGSGTDAGFGGNRPDSGRWREAKPSMGDLNPEESRKQSPEKNPSWAAGGVTYQVEDFEHSRVEDWMRRIGARVGDLEMTPALAWWLGREKRGGDSWNENQVAPGTEPNSINRERSSASIAGSRLWPVVARPPATVVIDFLPGEGLMPLKRYGGHFVTGTTPGDRLPPVPDRPETESRPIVRPSAPLVDERREDFMVHVRTKNGNLFEVYPVRTATPRWQTYLEHQGNFTLSFYGRAEQPWRFGENEPASLVFVFYPGEYPAVYEFRRAELVSLNGRGDGPREETARRFGQGEIVLYNFSAVSVTGSLRLPTGGGVRFSDGRSPSVATRDSTTSDSQPMTLTLAPMERRVVPVTITVPADGFRRMKAAIEFEIDVSGEGRGARVGTAASAAPTGVAARFVTEFFPALEGMERAVVAVLGAGKGPGGNRSVRNSGWVLARRRVAEEAPMTELANGWFVQEGADVSETAHGFAVTVTGAPPGKVQRVEVELPWSDGVGFPTDAFLSVDYRLRP